MLFPAFTLIQYIELPQNKDYHQNELTELSNVKNFSTLIFQLDVWFEILNLIYSAETAWVQ